MTSLGPLPQGRAADPSFQPFTGSIHSLTLPESAGTIQESFQGTASLNVIIVQDAHAIPEAQKSIRRIIGHFEETNGLSLVGLEGAASRLDTHFLKSFPRRDLLEELFDDYCAKGELPGAVAAAVFGKNGVEHYGIENPALYENGLTLYIEALDGEEAALKFMADEKKILEKKKSDIFSSDLLAADRVIQAFYEERLNLADFLTQLSAYREPPEESDVALMLARLRKGGSGAYSGESDVKKIARTIDQTLRSAKRTPEVQAESVVFYQKLQEFNTSRLSPEAFALYMNELSRKLDLTMNAGESLAALMKEQRTIEGIEGTAFFDNLESYIQSVKDGLIQTETERNLDRESAVLRLAEKAVRLELSRKEWVEFKSRLAEISQAYPKVDFTSRVRFYENAQERDGAFLERLTNLMKEKNKNLSLLVAGGFHAQGLSERLKAENISHILVMPKIEALPGKNHYRQHMRGDVSWKAYFTAEGGRVNLYNAFVRASRDELLRRSDEIPGVVLKNWRDAIIRGLSAAGRVDESSRYTAFIDEKADLKSGSAEERFQKVDRFISGMRSLEEAGKMTSQNILQLIRPSGITAASTAAAIQAPYETFNAPLVSAVFNSELRNQPRDPAVVRGAMAAEIGILKANHVIAVAGLKDRAEALLAAGAPVDATFQAEYSRIIENTIVSTLEAFDKKFALKNQMAAFVLGSLARRSAPYGTDIDMFFTASPAEEGAGRIIEAIVEALKEIIPEGVDFPATPEKMLSRVYFPDIGELSRDLGDMDGISLYSLLDRKFIFGDERTAEALDALLVEQRYGQYLDDWILVRSNGSLEADDPGMLEGIYEALDRFSSSRTKSLVSLRNLLWKKTGLRLSARQLKGLLSGRITPESMAEVDRHLLNYLRAQVEANRPYFFHPKTGEVTNVSGFEPKTGPGGLRTIQILGYIGRIQYRENEEVSQWLWSTGTTEELFKKLSDASGEEFLNSLEVNELVNAEKFFIRLRSAMNLAAEKAGREEAVDVYTPELEKAVAELMNEAPSEVRRQLALHQASVLNIAERIVEETGFRSELRASETAAGEAGDVESYGVLRILTTALVMAMKSDSIRIDVMQMQPGGEMTREASYKFQGPGEITIGRRDDQRVSIKAAYISGEHLALRYNTDRKKWEFRDLGSTNGTDIYGKIIGGDKKEKAVSDWMAFDEMDAFLAALAEVPTADLRATLFEGLRMAPQTRPSAYAQGKTAELLSRFSGIEFRWTAERSFLELVKQTAFDKAYQEQGILAFFMPGLGDQYINTATGTIRTISSVVETLAEVRIQPLEGQGRSVVIPVQELLTTLYDYKKFGVYERPAVKRQHPYLWRTGSAEERVQAVIDILLEHPLGTPDLHEEVQAFDPSGPPLQRMSHVLFKNLYELFRLNEAPGALAAIKAALEETPEYQAELEQFRRNAQSAVLPDPAKELTAQINELERSVDIAAVFDIAALLPKDVKAVEEDALIRAHQLLIELDQFMYRLEPGALMGMDNDTIEKANRLRSLRGAVGTELSRRETNRALGPAHEELRAEISRLAAVFGRDTLVNGIRFVRDGEVRVRIRFAPEQGPEQEQRARMRQAEAEIRRLTGIAPGQLLSGEDNNKLNAMISLASSARSELRSEDEGDEFPAERFDRLLTQAEKTLDSVEAFQESENWIDFSRDLEAGLFVFYGARDELLNELEDEFLDGSYESRFTALLRRIALIEAKIAEHSRVREPARSEAVEREVDFGEDGFEVFFGEELEEIETEIEQSQFFWLGTRDIPAMLSAMERLEELEGDIEAAIEAWSAASIETGERLLTRIAINRQELIATFEELRAEARSELREPGLPPEFGDSSNLFKLGGLRKAGIQHVRFVEDILIPFSKIPVVDGVRRIPFSLGSLALAVRQLDLQDQSPGYQPEAGGIAEKLPYVIEYYDAGAGKYFPISKFDSYAAPFSPGEAIFAGRAKLEGGILRESDMDVDLSVLPVDLERPDVEVAETENRIALYKMHPERDGMFLPKDLFTVQASRHMFSPDKQSIVEDHRDDPADFVGEEYIRPGHLEIEIVDTPLGPALKVTDRGSMNGTHLLKSQVNAAYDIPEESVIAQIDNKEDGISGDTVNTLVLGAEQTARIDPTESFIFQAKFPFLLTVSDPLGDEKMNLRLEIVDGQLVMADTREPWDKARLKLPRKFFPFPFEIEVRGVQLSKRKLVLLVKNIGTGKEEEDTLKFGYVPVLFIESLGPPVRSELRAIPLTLSPVPQAARGDESAERAEIEKTLSGILPASLEQLASRNTEWPGRSVLDRANALFHFLFEADNNRGIFLLDRLRIRDAASFETARRAAAQITEAARYVRIKGFHGSDISPNHIAYHVNLALQALENLSSAKAPAPDLSPVSVAAAKKEIAPGEIFELDYTGEPIVISLTRDTALLLSRDSAGKFYLSYRGQEKPVTERLHIGREIQPDFPLNEMMFDSGTSRRHLGIDISGNRVTFRNLSGSFPVSISKESSKLAFEQFPGYRIAEARAFGRIDRKEFVSLTPGEPPLRTLFDSIAASYESKGMKEKAEHMRHWSKIAASLELLQKAYKDLRYYNYQASESGSAELIEETLRQVRLGAPGIVPDDLDGWLWRQPDYLMAPAAGAANVMRKEAMEGKDRFRIGVNAKASPELIRTLDRLISTGALRGYYKVPPNAAQWIARHDPVTIYLHEGDLDRNPARKKAILETAARELAPYLRDNARLFDLGGEPVFDAANRKIPGLALDVTPTPDELNDLIDKGYAVSPALGSAIEVFLTLSRSNAVEASAGLASTVRKALEAPQQFSSEARSELRDNTFQISETVLRPKDRRMAPLVVGNIGPVLEDGDSVLEIGTGSGVLTRALSEGVRDKDVYFVATDINENAVADARSNLYDKANIEVRYGDLFSPLGKSEKFKVILWNPPWYGEARAGRRNDIAFLDEGYETLRRFLREAPGHLAKEGKIYLVFPRDLSAVLWELAEETGLNLAAVDAYKTEKRFIELYELTPAAAAAARSELRQRLEVSRPERVRQIAATIFGALVNEERETGEEELSKAADALASQADLRGALLAELEALKTEALRKDDFFTYLEAKGISRQVYVERVELEINMLMERIARIPHADTAVGFVASPENISNQTFMSSFIEALKNRGVRYVVITGESAALAAEKFRGQGFQVILPNARSKEILLPSLQRYTGMLTQAAFPGAEQSFENAVFVGRAASGEELDPATARYITALQTAVSLLIASEATDAVKLKEMLGNPAALLQKLYPEFDTPVIEGGADGLQISTVAIQAYLEWRAAEAMKASA